MKKVFCDLCKKEIPLKMRGVFPIEYNLCLSNNDIDRKDNVTEYEICKDCYNVLYEAFKRLED